jgi:23S rRNA pseudouridine1911/1915/1917 synthase
MSEIRSEVGLEDGGKTLEAFIRKVLDVPWGRARDLVRSGRVTIDATRVDDSAMRLRAGMVVVMNPDGARVPRLALQHSEVVHVDDDVIVVRKATGTLTVPTEDGERDTLVDRVRAYLRGLASATGRAAHDDEVGIVHRLDRETSGLIVFARSFAAKRELGEQFRVHSIGRTYLALVHGVAQSARIESMLLRDRGDGLRGSFGRPFPHMRRPFPDRVPGDAQRAVTHVEIVRAYVGASLVRCRLETGRQHQIRIHLSEAGHAVLGESVYIRDHRGTRINAPRVMLHATALSFQHPAGGEVTFEDPPPADFSALADKLARRR